MAVVVDVAEAALVLALRPWLSSVRSAAKLAATTHRAKDSQLVASAQNVVQEQHVARAVHLVRRDGHREE